MLIPLLILQAELRQVYSSGRHFVDSFGRKRLFHGVNAVFKTFPFYPPSGRFDSNYSLGREDFINLREWGFNMVRLHIAWEGVEPQPGIYNLTYIQKVKEIVDLAAEYRVFILLDAHQDLFSKKFCGEGVPDWATNRTDFPKPLRLSMDYDHEGNPTRESCAQTEFASFYLTHDVNRFQQDLLTNGRNLTDYLANAWRQVAQVFNNTQNLIGYQLLNQPSGPNFYRHPIDFVTPGAANNKYLLKFYKKIAERIREVDQNTIIFFEPTTFDFLDGGFKRLVEANHSQYRQAFSYHVYCPLVNKVGQPVDPWFCQFFDKNQIAGKVLNAQSLKVPGFLTQFGALSDSQSAVQQIERITSLTQKHFHSWCYWQFKYYNDITTAARPPTTQSFYTLDGHLQEHKVKALSRPYVYALCGEPISTHFDVSNKVFTYEFVYSSECGGTNSQVFISPLHFSLGFQAKFEPFCTNCALKKLKYSCYQLVMGGVPNGTKVKLTISGY